MKSYKSTKRRPEATYETDNDDFSAKIVKEAGKNLKAANDNLWEQLLGSSISSEGKANEGIVFEMSKLQKSEHSASDSEKKGRTKAERQPGDYHREYYESIAKFGERASYREVMQESRQIQQIMAELKKLVVTTKSLQVQFGLVSVEEAPANPGKYYLNFFEWMLITLKQARQKVEDSKSWLETVKGKGKKKKSYWSQAKKHGTTFSQSNERFAATSTG